MSAQLDELVADGGRRQHAQIREQERHELGRRVVARRVVNCHAAGRQRQKVDVLRLCLQVLLCQRVQAGELRAGYASNSDHRLICAVHGTHTDLQHKRVEVHRVFRTLWT